MVLGLDNFKNFNELLGRTAGDQVLKLFAERLSQTTNTPLARLEGDTFSLLLQGTQLRQVSLLVETYLNELARPFTLHKEDMVITATAGISSYPSDGSTPLKLIENAEIAMFRAKESGIQRFEFFTPDMQATSLQRLRLNKALLEALEESQFTVYFQPQIHIPHVTDFLS